MLTYRQCLLDSGLFLEGTDFFSKDPPINAYYGFNVSKMEKEPIDQIHGFLAAKRIQEWNYGKCKLSGEFYPFVAGVFEVLNARTLNEMNRILETNLLKDQRKKRLFEKVMNKYGLQGKVFLTQDLWKDPAYWEIFNKQFSSKRFTKEDLIKDTLKFYNGDLEKLNSVIRIKEIPTEVMEMTDDVLEKIGDWPASIIYTPAEFSEAVYFNEIRRVNLKIGHVEERVYDKYVMELMDVLHLRQPVDIASKRTRPSLVTPYIEKHRPVNKIRIFFNETATDISSRISEIVPEEYIFTIEQNAGEILNPFVEKVIFAVESARCLGEAPITIAGKRIREGIDVIQKLEQGRITLQDIKKCLPMLVESYITGLFECQ